MAEFYPFPSNVHIISAVTIKLTNSNYLLWKTQFESLLSSHKLLGFVTGDTPAPERTIFTPDDDGIQATPNPRYDSWFCTDQLVRSWLFGTLTEAILGFVHRCTTSHEVWSSLASNFNRSSLAREFELRRNLQLLTKKGKTFDDYRTEFQSLCDSLSSIGRPIEESMKIFTFLNGLGREFDPISVVLLSSLSKDQCPAFSDIHSEVAGYDARLQTYDEAPSTNQHLTFQTQRSGFYDNNNRGRGNSYDYGQRGRGYSRYNQNRGRGGYSTRGRGFTQHQPYNPSANRFTCQICHRDGHTADRCYSRYENGPQNSEKALTSVRASESSTQDWYPDSGASAHVTTSSSHLQNSTTYPGNDTIMVGNGAYLPITHIGSTTLSTPAGSITLNEVLICPSITKSLFQFLNYVMILTVVFSLIPLMFVLLIYLTRK